MDLLLNNATDLHNVMYHGFMPSPQTRSTTDVLWTCLATILLCVYTAVHLNIPEPGEPRRWQFLRRAKWVIIAIFAPEIVLQVAWKQYRMAKALQSRLKLHATNARQLRSPTPRGRTDEEANDSTYELLAGQRNTGNKVDVSENVTEVAQIPDDKEFTLIYAFYVLMGGIRLEFTDDPNYSDFSLAGKSLCLTNFTLDELAREHGHFFMVSTTSIQDKSKADNLAKLLTVLQVMWMIVECIARKRYRLPIALLEIHTFIHALCGGLLFAFWFYKPLDIRDATVVQCPASIRPEVQKIYETQMASLTGNLPSHLVTRQVNFGKGWASRADKNGIFDQLSSQLILLTDEGEFAGDTQDLMSLLGLGMVQVAYAGLHLSAWHAHFPSLVEQWCWRIACISIPTTFLVIVAIIFWVLGRESESDTGALWSRMVDILLDILDKFSVIFTVILFLMWVVARLFLVVESFVSLRNVPIGVYKSIPWSSAVPHI